jgi:hypothetical protein
LLITFDSYCVGNRAQILDLHPEAHQVIDYALNVCRQLAVSINRLDNTILQSAVLDVARTLSRRVTQGHIYQQPMLLQLLLELLHHSSFNAVANDNTKDRSEPSGSTTESNTQLIKSISTSKAELASIVSPAALEAITSHKCRSVLRDWISFIPKFARYLGDADVNIVLPALNRFCQELTRASSQAVAGTGAESSWDLDALLDGLEEFVVGCLDEESANANEHTKSYSASRTNKKNGQANIKLREVLLSQLSVILQVAVDIWQSIGDQGTSSSSSSTLAISTNDNTHITPEQKYATPWQSHRTQTRIMNFIEHLGVLCRDDIANAILDVWFEGQGTRSGEDVISIIRQLTSIRPVFMFKKLYKKIRNSNSLRSSTHGRPSEAGDSFVTCFDFLTRYCLVVEPAEWLVLWPRTIDFIRDLVNQGNRTRSFWIACIQYFITGWEKTNSLGSNFSDRAAIASTEASLIIGHLTAANI